MATPEPKLAETPSLIAAAPVETPKPVETPAVVEPPKPADTPAVVEPPKPVEAKAPEPPKPAETTVEVKPEVKTEEAKTAAAAEAPKPESLASAEPIKYEPFKTPEGMTLDQGAVDKYTGVLSKHKISQEAAQEILNLYTAEAQTLVDQMATSQVKVWNDTNESWKNEVRADPELGGNRLETVLSGIAGLIERFGGDAAGKKAIREAFTLTGAGNHPAIVRLLHRAASALGEGRPVPAVTPKEIQPTGDRASRRYASSIKQG